MNTCPVLPVTWNVPQELRDQVGEFASRQRELQAQDHLLLVLHQVPPVGNPERRSVILWRAPDGRWFALRERSHDEELEELEARQAMQELLRAYDARIDELEARFAAADGAQELFHILRETIPVLRAMKNMLAPLTTARERLPKVRELLVWREQAYGTERAVELLYEEARAALDFTIAEEAEVQSHANLEMARAAHRLNAMIALFLPLTAIGSAFGMNVINGMEENGPWLFWVLLATGIAVGYLMRTLIDRRARALEQHDEPAARSKRRH